MSKKTIFFVLSAFLMSGAMAGCSAGSSTVSTVSTQSQVSQVSEQSSRVESSIIESSVELSSKEESSKVEVSEDIDGYKYAVFNTYNSYASENGLDGTLIYVNAYVKEITDSSPFSGMIVLSDDDGKWFITIGYDSVFSTVDLENTFKNKNIRCFGVYLGYSDVEKAPAMFVTKIECDGKTYNYRSDDLQTELWGGIDIQKLALQCDEYTYKQLARNPNDYMGKLVKLKGEVVQVMEDGLNVTLRVNVTFTPYSYDSSDGYYEDTVYVNYKRESNNESRILEDDIVTIYGVSDGNTSYTTVLGSEVTLPKITAFQININE